MVDFYFRRPVILDFIIASVLTYAAKLLLCKKILAIPKEDHLFAIVSDLSTISLTLAGFVLTLLTVLVSYKSTVKRKLKDERPKENDSSYDVFFSTSLYFTTVSLLKNAIKSMVVIAILGYVLKLTLDPVHYDKLFLYSVAGITMIVLTLWRCILILSGIVSLQKDK